ncbi:MAG: serine hydrolase domain-containing protein [Candidatus Heimdallarchaeota archaeon]
MSKKIVDEELISSFKMNVSKSVNEGGIIGLSAALVRKSGPIWLESFGFTDASKQQEVNENTLFSLQSTTKTVTAVAFLLAVQKGLVGLDDPIHTYCPELKMKSIYGADEYKKITFRHLLSHTSSLPREPRIGGCFSRKVPESFEEHILSINDCWLQGPVGSAHRYSNIGLDLVPYLLEKIVKKPYTEYLQEVLGDPLGITYYWNVDVVYKTGNASKGYLSYYEAHKLDSVALGCGGAFISLRDHATFVQFLLNNGNYNGKTILEPKYIEMLREPFKESADYGLGTSLPQKYGIKLSNHAGGGFGFGSEMYWLPDFDIGIIILYNNENAFYSSYSPSIAINKFLEEYLEKAGVDTSIQIKQKNDDVKDAFTEKLAPPKPEWKKYTGIYYEKYYYTEYIYAAVSLEKGYLKFQGNRLYPHESLPNIFYNEAGVITEFHDDSFFFDNSEFTKQDDVVKIFAKRVNSHPNHRSLMPWVFDSIASGLEQLNRDNDAKSIINLKKRHASGK